MRVNGVTGDSQAPSMGLRQGCSLSATLFGPFIDGLHHYLETAVPTAGNQILQMRLSELVYADDICLLASLPEQLQALHLLQAILCLFYSMGVRSGECIALVVLLLMMLMLHYNA